MKQVFVVSVFVMAMIVMATGANVQQPVAGINVAQLQQLQQQLAAVLNSGVLNNKQPQQAMTPVKPAAPTSMKPIPPQQLNAPVKQAAINLSNKNNVNHKVEPQKPHPLIQAAAAANHATSKSPLALPKKRKFFIRPRFRPHQAHAHIAQPAQQGAKVVPMAATQHQHPIPFQQSHQTNLQVSKPQVKQAVKPVAQVAVVPLAASHVKPAAILPRQAAASPHPQTCDTKGIRKLTVAEYRNLIAKYLSIKKGIIDAAKVNGSACDYTYNMFKINEAKRCYSYIIRSRYRMAESSIRCPDTCKTIGFC